jgi:hypothetical protein
VRDLIALTGLVMLSVWALARRPSGPPEENWYCWTCATLTRAHDLVRCPMCGGAVSTDVRGQMLDGDEWTMR